MKKMKFNSEKYSGLFSNFADWTPAALMKKDAYYHFQSFFNEIPIEKFTDVPIPLLTGYEKVIKTPFDKSDIKKASVYLKSEDTDNIVKMINDKVSTDRLKTKMFVIISILLIFLGTDYDFALPMALTFMFLIVSSVIIRNVILINGDYIYLGGGYYEWGLKFFEEKVKEKYSTELKDISNDRLYEIWNEYRQDIYERLTQRVVSSEENICHSSNFIDTVKALAPDWIFARTFDNLSYQEMWTNPDVVARKPFCGNQKVEVNQKVAELFPTLWKKDIVDILSNGDGFCIKNLTMYRDHKMNFLSTPHTFDAYYFVGPIWDNINFDNIEADPQHTVLRNKFKKIINNIMTNVYYIDNRLYFLKVFYFMLMLNSCAFFGIIPSIISYIIFHIVNDYVISHDALFTSVIGGRFQILKNLNDPKNHPSNHNFAEMIKNPEFKKQHDKAMEKVAEEERQWMANYMIYASMNSTFDSYYLSCPKQ